MIKEKDIRESRVVRFQNGSGISLESIRSELQNLASREGIMVALDDEQLRFGSLFNSTTENCLLLYHPDHRKDYINSILRLTRQGNYAFLHIYEYGQSKMAVKMYAATDARTEAREERRSMPLGERIGAALADGLVNGLMSIGANKQKYEQEQQWYAIVEDIIDEFCGLE